MYISTQSLSHFPSAYVGNRMQSKAVEQLIDVQQVFSYAVDNQWEQLVLLVEEKGHGEVANLLFGVFVRRDEVDSFEMAEVHVPA